jgi:hypothetical protein
MPLLTELEELNARLCSINISLLAELADISSLLSPDLSQNHVHNLIEKPPTRTGEGVAQFFHSFKVRGPLGFALWSVS